MWKAFTLVLKNFPGKRLFPLASVILGIIADRFVGRYLFQESGSDFTRLASTIATAAYFLFAYILAAYVISTLRIISRYSLDKIIPEKSVKKLPLPSKISIDQLSDGIAQVKVFVARNWAPNNQKADVEEFLRSVELSAPFCPACKADLVGRYDTGDLFNYLCPDSQCVNKGVLYDFNIDTFKQNILSKFSGKVRKDFDKYWQIYVDEYKKLTDGHVEKYQDPLL